MVVAGLDSNTREKLFALYRQGDFAGLADQIQLLLESFPNDPMLPSLMGAAQMELGDYQLAVKYYQRALQLRPGFEKLLNSLGICYLKLNRVTDAKESFEQALKRNPEFAPAWFNLGLVYENGQQWQQAIEAYEKTVALEPGHFEAHTALGSSHWRTGEYTGVSEAYSRALACKPDHVPAHRNLLDFLTKSSQHETLRHQLEQASRHIPSHYLVSLYGGILADIDGDYELARELLEQTSIDAVDDAQLYDERQRLARLTRLCDQLGDSKAVINYALKGNQISRQIAGRNGVSKDTFLGYIDNREAVFTDTYSEKGVVDFRGSRNRPPVFIVGFPRSGTTLLDTILRGHPRTAVAEESNAVPGLVNELSGENDEQLESLATLSSGKMERLRQLYLSSMEENTGHKPGERLMIDRFASNIIYAGEIHRVFPEARFVLVIRHPVDVVLSCYLQTFTESSLNANFFSLEDSAFIYSRVLCLWKTYEKLLRLNVHVVKYEDLIRDTEGSCRSLLDYLDLDWDPRVLDHRKTAGKRSMIKTVSYNQVTQNLYQDAIGRWCRYREYLEPVFDTLRPWVDELGYEI